VPLAGDDDGARLVAVALALAVDAIAGVGQHRRLVAVQLQQRALAAGLGRLTGELHLGLGVDRRLGLGGDHRGRVRTAFLRAQHHLGQLGGPAGGGGGRLRGRAGAVALQLVAEDEDPVLQLLDLALVLRVLHAQRLDGPVHLRRRRLGVRPGGTTSQPHRKQRHAPRSPQKPPHHRRCLAWCHPRF
jgi:hypothetical protein